MREFTWLAGLLFTFSMNAQLALPVQMDTSLFKAEITAFGVLDYSATSIQNRLSEKLIFGGFIENDDKLGSMNKHKTHNKMGLEALGEIDYKNYNLGSLLNGKYGFYVRAGYGALASASYTDDLFGLAFYGNQKYLGDTALFSGTEANFVSFQKIGFGLISKGTKSSFGVNYYNISDYSEGFVRKGELSSDSNGTNLILNLDTRVQHANSSKFNKGWGIGFDGDFRFKADWIKDRVVFFQAQFKNIGLMHINDVDIYKLDSTYTYSGFTFNQLFGNNAVSYKDETEVMDSLGIQKTNRSITTLLPGFVQIGKITDDNSNEVLQSFFGVRLYTTLAYNPLVYGGVEYKFYPWLKVGLQALYGGFSKFRLGFYSQYSFKSLHFAIGSENIIGALSNTGSGQSIHVRIAKRW